MCTHFLGSNLSAITQRTTSKTEHTFQGVGDSTPAVFQTALEKVWGSKQPLLFLYVKSFRNSSCNISLRADSYC